MQGTMLSLVLSGLGRDALKVAAGLVVAALLALAFAVSSVAALLVPLAPVLPGGAATAPVGVHSVAAGTQVVEVARTQIGRPYLWGGASPAAGFDCSGLVQWAYGQVGVALPRTAQQQFDATARLGPDQLRPGDLVFFARTNPASAEFITHVGIYAGGGQMVNAPTRGRRRPRDGRLHRLLGSPLRRRGPGREVAMQALYARGPPDLRPQRQVENVPRGKRL